MEIFVEKLQERSKELGLTQADVARLAGLNERRFNHYARGRRQPDLATLVRIAEALKTTPNWLLGVDPPATSAHRQQLVAKAMAKCMALDISRLNIAITLLTALAQHEDRDDARKAGGTTKRIRSGGTGSAE